MSGKGKARRDTCTMTDPVSPETATAEPLDALIDRAITAWNCDGPDGPPALGAFIAWWLNEKGWEIRRAGSAVPAVPPDRQQLADRMRAAWCWPDQEEFADEHASERWCNAADVALGLLAPAAVPDPPSAPDEESG